MSWRHSRVWKSPRVQANESNHALNNARYRICRNSPFWYKNFDIVQHRQEVQEAEEEKLRYKTLIEEKEAEQKAHQERNGYPSESKPMRQPFDGKVFKDNRSNVLSRRTIFCPQWQEGKEDIAPWPKLEEAKYEGQDRLSTDRLHGRFLGLPRVETNQTVNWQQRPTIYQYPFENFYYPILSEEEIEFRRYWVQDVQFTGQYNEEIDEDGVHALGAGLIALLDPRDQW